MGSASSARAWASAHEHELYLEGDRERQHGLVVQPMKDRKFSGRAALHAATQVRLPCTAPVALAYAAPRLFTPT